MGAKGLTTVAVAAFGLPAAVGTLLKDTVARNPLVAVLMLIIYWMALGIVGLVKTALKGPLQYRLEQLGDAVDAALGRKLSRYARHYRKHVLIANRWVDFKGLSIVGDHTPELDEVFVDVSVERGQVDPGIVARSGRSRQLIHDFLYGEHPQVLAVVGGPGSGKTTLLRHLARQTARRTSGKRRIPIFLSLSRLSTPIGEDLSVPQLLRIKPHELRVPEPKGWWEHQLFTGNCLILMDGLDEVADEMGARAVSDWIARQVKSYPDNDFVITSRPGGYRKAPVTGAQILGVQPFNRDQVDRFLRRWYRATERDATGADDSGVDTMAEENATDLIERLKDAPGLDELTTNPLLLTMIALVHKNKYALPRGRADLYQEICQAMLWSRHEAKGLAVNMSGEGKREVLSKLAFEMMRSRLRNVEVSMVSRLIEDAIEISLPDTSCERFLNDVCANGLLIQPERGVYAFTHHTIGEYLAAKHIADCSLETELESVVNDSWWTETIELYAASVRNVDTIVRICLDRGTTSSIALAFKCAGYGSVRESSLRDRLRRLEDQAFGERADPAVRRAISSALVSRHLGRLKRLGEGGPYCPHPITTDLYWLYCQETGVREPDSPHAFTPDAARVATGMVPEGVVGFVDWANEVIRSGDRTGARVRLPDRDEARLITDTDAKVPAEATGVFCRDQTDGQTRVYDPAGENTGDDTVVILIRD